MHLKPAKLLLLRLPVLGVLFRGSEIGEHDHNYLIEVLQTFKKVITILFAKIPLTCSESGYILSTSIYQKSKISLRIDSEVTF